MMNEFLKCVTFKEPSSLALTFVDGTFSIALERLEMPINRFRWETAKADPAGNAMTVKAKSGEVILIDASTLRYLVDKVYAATVDAKLQTLQFSDEELERIVRDNPPPPEWFQQPSRDLKRESWK